MIRVVRVALASLLLVSGVAAAAAPEEGWFVGAAAGSSEIDDKAFRSTNTVLSTDDKDSAWQLWGGYRLASWVAMQGRYTSLGQYSDSVDSGAGAGINSFDSKGLTVDMKLIWPFGESGIDVYAQLGLGVAQWDGDYAAVADKPAASASGKEPLVTYGLGVRWTIIKALTLSLAVDAYQFEGKAVRNFPNPNFPCAPVVCSSISNETLTFDANILTTNLGLQYNF